MTTPALRRNRVTGINRIGAFFLALVWLCGGAAGIAIGVLYERWPLAALGVLAVAYAILWTRVAAQSQLLTWRKLAAPWRSR